MIHITKAQGGYMTVVLARNRKVLATSEILKSRRSAWKNADSLMSEGVGVKVQDDTTMKAYEMKRGRAYPIKPVAPYKHKK